MYIQEYKMLGKNIEWNEEKNNWLKHERAVSFELFVKLIANNSLLAVNIHHSKDRINQKLMLVLYKDYVWVIPFTESETLLFLKTIYPSRKYTKLLKQYENI